MPSATGRGGSIRASPSSAGRSAAIEALRKRSNLVCRCVFVSPLARHGTQPSDRQLRAQLVQAVLGQLEDHDWVSPVIVGERRFQLLKRLIRCGAHRVWLSHEPFGD
jgi:hypothetical protein